MDDSPPPYLEDIFWFADMVYEALKPPAEVRRELGAFRQAIDELHQGFQPLEPTSLINNLNSTQTEQHYQSLRECQLQGYDERDDQWKASNRQLWETRSIIPRHKASTIVRNDHGSFRAALI